MPVSIRQQSDEGNDITITETLIGAASDAVDQAFRSGDTIGAIVNLAQKVRTAGTVYDVFNAISAYAANDDSIPVQSEGAAVKL